MENNLISYFLEYENRRYHFSNESEVWEHIRDRLENTVWFSRVSFRILRKHAFEKSEEIVYEKVSGKRITVKGRRGDA